jgi:thioredoxin 1
MAVNFVTDSDFEEKVLKGDQVTLVDFYADWCGPCKLAEPVLNELSDEYKGKLTISKLDVDNNQATSQKYGVMSIPTIIAFKGGEEVDRMSGFGGKEGYVRLIDKVLNG